LNTDRVKAIQSNNQNPLKSWTRKENIPREISYIKVRSKKKGQKPNIGPNFKPCHNPSKVKFICKLQLHSKRHFEENIMFSFIGSTVHPKKVYM